MRNLSEEINVPTFLGSSIQVQANFVLKSEIVVFKVLVCRKISMHISCRETQQRDFRKLRKHSEIKYVLQCHDVKT